MRYFTDISDQTSKTTVLPDGGEYTMRVFAGRDAAFQSMQDKKIRTTSLLEARDEASRRYYGFFAEKDDPMAERLLIPGDPFELASLCVNKARLFELLSFGAVGLSYAMNLVCALILFGFWIVR